MPEATGLVRTPAAIATDAAAGQASTGDKATP